LAVEDTRKYLDDICENRFELADAFLVYLHSNPFVQGGAADGPEASKTLLALATQIMGPDIVSKVNVVWSRTPKVRGQCQCIWGTHLRRSLRRQLAG